MVVAFTALYLAFAALYLFSFLNSQCGEAAGTTTTSAQAPLLDSAAEVLPPLAALGILFVAVALTYHHLMGRRVGAAPVAGAGNGRRSISGLLIFALCVAAGTLELILFGAQATGGGGGAEGHGAQLARALGLAALRALPAASTGAFFSGMALILVVAHVRAGGEGGGVAVAADGPMQGFLRLLTKVVAGMVAALVGLMLMALTLHGGARY